MARMIPPVVHPGCLSDGEITFFNLFKSASNTLDWTVFHSLDLTRHPRKVSTEIDFVVAVPGKGVLCLEVKTAKNIRRHEGKWYYGKDAKGHSESPFKQASSAMHQLREQCKNHPDLKGILFWSAVAFPNIEFDIRSPEWHSWQIIDHAKMLKSSLPELVVDILNRAAAFMEQVPTAKWFDPQLSRPTKDQIDILTKVLRGDFEVYEKPHDRLKHLDAELLRYTEEQFYALDAMESNSRIIFHGPAGTGKTVLALETARRAAASGARTLFLCYNSNLARWISSQIAAMEVSDWVSVSTIHKYMLGVSGLQVPENPTDEFWEAWLPEKTQDCLLEGRHSPFDLLVVDELQDVGVKYADILDLSVMGGIGSGKWRLFGDFENQTLYGDVALSQVKNVFSNAATYRLNVNCRNTPRTTALVDVLGVMRRPYSKVLRPDNGIDPEVSYYGVESEKPLLLRKILHNLSASGRNDAEIIILSEASTEQGVVHALLQEPMWARRIVPFQPGQKKIGYSSIKSFKGLESPVVIITDLRLGSRGAFQQLYTGLTRGTDQTFVMLSHSDRPTFQQLILKQFGEE